MRSAEQPCLITTSGLPDHILVAFSKKKKKKKKKKKEKKRKHTAQTPDDLRKVTSCSIGGLRLIGGLRRTYISGSSCVVRLPDISKGHNNKKNGVLRINRLRSHIES